MTQKNKKIDKFIPYFFFIFFGVIFIADFSFVYIAKKSWRGVYTKESYQKGKDYNKAIEASKKQKSLGWKIDLKYERVKENSAVLTSCLKDKNNKNIVGAKLKAKIFRPTQEGYDFVVDFLPKNKCYESKINFPLKGVWDIEIQAFHEKDIFQYVKRYVVR